jgi:hypothetical protein
MQYNPCSVTFIGRQCPVLTPAGLGVYPQYRVNHLSVPGISSLVLYNSPLALPIVDSQRGKKPTCLNFENKPSSWFLVAFSHSTTQNGS